MDQTKMMEDSLRQQMDGQEALTQRTEMDRFYEQLPPELLAALARANQLRKKVGVTKGYLKTIVAIQQQYIDILTKENEKLLKEVKELEEVYDEKIPCSADTAEPVAKA